MLERPKGCIGGFIASRRLFEVSEFHDVPIETYWRPEPDLPIPARKEALSPSARDEPAGEN
jgi:hypothetical protein